MKAVENIWKQLSELNLSSEKVKLSASEDLDEALRKLNNLAKFANKRNDDIGANYNEAKALDEKANKAYIESNEIQKKINELSEQVKERLKTSSELAEVSSKYLVNVNEAIRFAKTTIQGIDEEIKEAQRNMSIIEKQANELGIKASSIGSYSKAKSRIPQIEKIKRNLELAIKQGLKPL